MSSNPSSNPMNHLSLSPAQSHTCCYAMIRTALNTPITVKPEVCTVAKQQYNLCLNLLRQACIMPSLLLYSPMLPLSGTMNLKALCSTIFLWIQLFTRYALPLYDFLKCIISHLLELSSICPCSTQLSTQSAAKEFQFVCSTICFPALLIIPCIKVLQKPMHSSNVRYYTHTCSIC